MDTLSFAAVLSVGCEFGPAHRLNIIEQKMIVLTFEMVDCIILAISMS